MTPSGLEFGHINVRLLSFLAFLLFFINNKRTTKPEEEKEECIGLLKLSSNYIFGVPLYSYHRPKAEAAKKYHHDGRIKARAFYYYRTEFRFPELYIQIKYIACTTFGISFTQSFPKKTF